jgi:hypothetical protein
MLLGMSTTGGAEDRESALEQLEQISSTSQGLDSLQGQERDLLHVLVQVSIISYLRLFAFRTCASSPLVLEPFRRQRSIESTALCYALSTLL